MYSSERFVEYKKGVLIMGKPITEKELEKYDYLRAEYYKENGRWPYSPRPLTNYEKFVMNFFALGSSCEIQRAKTYADISLADLYSILDLIKERREVLLAVLDFINNMMSSKGKNFSQNKVIRFLNSLRVIYEHFVKYSIKVIGVVSEEGKSILGYLDGSEYYNRNKSDLAKQCLKCKYDESENKDGLKAFYLNPGDIKFLCSTVFKSIPQNIGDEIKNRETYLSNKKNRDYSDFMDMQKKVIALYNSGQFSKGDDLLLNYTRMKYALLNGVARNSFDLKLFSDLGDKDKEKIMFEGKAPKGNAIIDEDLFIKTVVELAELRERLRNSKGVEKTLWERWVSGKYLYRGLPLYKLLQRIHGGVLPNKWHGKKKFEEDSRDDVIKYLTGKIAVDPASLSTSLDPNVSKGFLAKEDGDTGSILVIDISGYDKGQDLASISSRPREKEILLPMGVKLKIKSVSFKKEGSDGYFEVNCVPI